MNLTPQRLVGQITAAAGGEKAKTIKADSARQTGAPSPHPLLNHRSNTMHYRNGREAKNGDTIVQLDYSTGKITALGLLYNATAGNDYCNGNIAPIQPAGQGACMCDCLHIDDLAELLKTNGLATRPANK